MPVTRAHTPPELSAGLNQAAHFGEPLAGSVVFIQKCCGRGGLTPLHEGFQEESKAFLVNPPFSFLRSLLFGHHSSAKPSGLQGRVTTLRRRMKGSSGQLGR